MIDPNSPIVTAARDAQAAALARGATLEEATAEGLEAAIASWRKSAGMFGALSLPSDLTAIAKEERT